MSGNLRSVLPAALIGRILHGLRRRRRQTLAPTDRFDALPRSPFGD